MPLQRYVDFIQCADLCGQPNIVIHSGSNYYGFLMFDEYAVDFVECEHEYVSYQEECDAKRNAHSLYRKWYIWCAQQRSNQTKLFRCKQQRRHEFVTDVCSLFAINMKTIGELTKKKKTTIISLHIISVLGSFPLSLCLIRNTISSKSIDKLLFTERDTLSVSLIDIHGR